MTRAAFGALIVALGLSGMAVSGQAQTPAAADPAAPVPTISAPAAPAGGAADGPRPLGDAERQGIGCALGGVGLFSATYVAGPSEAIMLLGGGLLVPSSNTLLAASLLATIAASGCAIGSVVAPTVTWAVDQWDNIWGRVGQESVHAQRSLGRVWQPLSDTLFGALPAPRPTVTAVDVNGATAQPAPTVAR